MMDITYINCKEAADKLNETNDCGVKALAISAQISYGKARFILESVGRKHRRGINGRMIVEAMNKIRVTPLVNEDVKSTVVEFGRRVTPNTFAKLKPTGSYFCITRNHAIAIRNGVVEDWTAGRKNQIKAFIKVED